MNLNVGASTVGVVPAVNLTWDNRFDEVSPTEFRLSIIADNFANETRTLSSSVTAAIGPSDHSYMWDNLSFFTRYTFIVVAVYNLTGSEAVGSGVSVDHTTEEGGKWV